MSERKFGPKPEQPFFNGKKILEVPLDRLRSGDIIQVNLRHSEDGALLFAVLDKQDAPGVRSFKTVKIKVTAAGHFAYLDGLSGELMHERLRTDDQFSIYNLMQADGNPASIGSSLSPGGPFGLGRIVDSFQVFPSTEK